MKEYIVNEFCHIKPSTEEIQNLNSQDIIIDNYANMIPILQKYNEQWFNIYKTFNTFFDWKRRSENINELRAILIDIDYKDTEKEDFISIRKKCKLLEQKYNIFPYEINDTYKWYHLLFSLDKSLYYIKNEIYLDIATALVWYFDADMNAKQITGLYKMVWFIDHKENRNFLIKNIYSATKVSKESLSINIDTLKAFWSISETANIKEILKDKIYWVKTKWNDDWEIWFSKFEISNNEKSAKLYEVIEKKNIKYEIYNLIENIDSMTFIDAINDYNKWSFKDVNVIVNNKNIDWTNWLYLYYKNDKWEIKDFAHKNRFSNRWFLINHVLKLNEEKSETIRKKKVLDYLNFLRDKFWIIFNKAKKTFYMNSKLLLDYLQNKIIINEMVIEEIAKSYNSKYLDMTNKTKYIDAVIYTYMIIEYIKQTEFNNVNNFSIPYKKILDFVWIQTNNENKTKLKFILDLWSRLNIVYDFYNEKWKRINISKKLYNVKFSDRNFEYITTINNVSDKMNNSFVHFNEKIFNSKWFFNKENFKIILYVTYSIKKFKTVKISINQILNILWKDISEYNDLLYLYKKINKIMELLKYNKIITYYQRNKTTYTLWKVTKPKKESWKK